MYLSIYVCIYIYICVCITFMFVLYIYVVLMCLYCIPIQGRNFHPKQLSPRTVCTRKRGFPWQPPFCTGGSRLDDSGGGSEKGSGIPLRFCWNLSRKTWHGFEWYWRFMVISSVTWLRWTASFLVPRAKMSSNLDGFLMVNLQAFFHVLHRQVWNPTSFFSVRKFRIFPLLQAVELEVVMLASENSYIMINNIQFNCQPSPLATSHV